MDKHSKIYQGDHRELDDWHSPNGIRDMIDNIVESIGNIYPQTATDYVKIAYGHVCLDEKASEIKKRLGLPYSELDWFDIYKRAYRSFISHGFNKKVYQPRRY